ncbi:hypothetical protein AVO45_15750 [Ruegeria marisrubri]|uniref:Polysaccharide biosynthesis protein n=1 Tax=Ruegeria marisrubri TaxID=1685379 RepID=A0A0X3TBX8_9RHOB|nr:oligosaccharide flippase family protein [Ruegeria marisrubri]KUJ73193.1 hypothetical protein AVO45_15750 [Ruegeria marisrubri]
MSPTFWSTVLQFSRLAVNASLLLVASRFLTLAEIGTFATAFAPVRLTQGVLRAGLGDAAILHGERRNALIALSLTLGLTVSLILAGAALLLPPPVGPTLAALAPIPLIQSIAQPSESYLRRQMRLRALAMRTMVAQSTSAALALLVLAQGGGTFSLVTFALANTALTGALSIWLSPIGPSTRPHWREIRAILPDTLRLSLRDLAGNATLPLLQLAIGACLGLAAAGAFQIAARFLSLIDALAIAPIRYVALPRFAGLPRPALREELTRSMSVTARVACLVYPLALLAAPKILAIAVGPAHAASVAPLMPAFCLTGLLTALAMPVTQALSAAGAIRLTLTRSLATLGMTLILALPGLQTTLNTAIWALPTASLLVLLWYIRAAQRWLRPAPARAAA